jgi:hypothetical protein
VKKFRFYDRMKMVDGDLVCGRYPCMSHSGKGVRCIAKGCMKYVRPMKGEKRELQCVFHRFKKLTKCIHPGCINDGLQGGVCWCHGAKTKLCCYDAKLFNESTRKWTVSYCTNYSRKGGECTKHSGDVHTCSYNKYGQKCTNRAKHGGICYEHYLESLI